MLNLLAIFLLSFAIVLLATPLAKLVAFKLNILDAPGHRKIHSRPIPLFGGVVIFAAFFMVAILPGLFDRTFAGILLTGGLLIAFGLLDDRGIKMRARVKIFTHLAVSFLFIYLTGLSLDFFRLGLLNWGITACFITFMANSFNMLDGMDGLVAGITSIAAAFFFLLGLMGGQYEIMALSTIVIGSTLGFVVYNFNPASIFLGEAGSTFLGFAMAVLAISMRVHFAWDAPICMGFTNLSCLYFIIPLVILGIPIFDTYFVFINRFFHNLKFSTPGTDHSHHRIHLMGFSQRNTVLILYLVQVVLGLVALVMVHASFYQLIALCGVLLVMVISAAVFLTQVKVYDPS